jgi:anaerobic selenocysteine-containing dehydrogenase
MKKIDISRRDFLKGTAATTLVAAAALAGKEISDSQKPVASMGDLKIVEEPAKFSCLDYINSMKKQ